MDLKLQEEAIDLNRKPSSGVMKIDSNRGDYIANYCTTTVQLLYLWVVLSIGICQMVAPYR